MAVNDDEVGRGSDPWKGALWVRIMCDFAADAVWNIDGESCCIEDLPISELLATRLKSWQKHYDNFCPTFGAPSDRWDIHKFSHDGRVLACEVKQQLPNWIVVYFDEAKFTESGDGRRSLYEYEIVL